jgi:3-hydroxybutyryl-CoA dehydrogenase
MAQALAVAGRRVTCTDVDDVQLDRAAQLTSTGRYGLEGAVERGKLAPAAAEAARDRLTFSTDLERAAATADLVLEAVPEDIHLKRDLFERLDALAPAAAILATNTSGLSIAKIAQRVAPDRAPNVIGWHWASPAAIMPLAEIVVTDATSPETTTAVVALAAACGKHPVVVCDQPATWGHVGNRIYAAATAEALRILDEGLCDEAGIDQIMMDAFNWPAGPFGMSRGAREGWQAT